MNKVVTLGRPQATGIFSTHEELVRHIHGFFALFPHASCKQCAELVEVSVGTVHRIKTAI